MPSVEQAAAVNNVYNASAAQGQSVGAKHMKFVLASKDLYEAKALAWLHRMKEGQKDIFYMAADSLDAASSAPFVERLVQRDYEVNTWMLST